LCTRVPFLSAVVMAAVAPPGAGGALPPAQLTSKAIARYRGSAPINFRLVLVNSLVLVGSAYIIVTSLDRYNTARSDLDGISRTSVFTAKPCGMAVPNLKMLFQSMKEIGDGAFAEDIESTYVERARNSICGTASMNNAIRSAMQATEIEDDCCSGYETTDERYKSAEDLDEKVKTYVCACETETCTKGHGLGDMERRIKHAYVLSAPAFAVYEDSRGTSGEETCASPNDPFSPVSCAADNDLIRDQIRSQLSVAADNSFKILAGEPDADGAKWPTTTAMIYRLMCLAVVEYYDRVSNSGVCFSNTAASPTNAIDFCKSKLAKSTHRPLGDPWPGGCANAAEHLYYSDRIANSESCTYTEGDPPSSKTELWTQRPRKFSALYANASMLPVYAICSSMLEFGLLDRKRLFGLPDPVGEYEWQGEHTGNSFTRWLAGIGYWGLFDANKDKSEVSDLHTAYVDLKLFVGYRYAMTSAWVIAAFVACGYVLAFSSVPFLKLIYIRLIRRTLTNTRTDTILLKPTSGVELFALFMTVVVGLWVIFVDVAGAAPYVTNSECGDYTRFGGAYETTTTRPRDGLLGLSLVLLGTGIFLYTASCRRPPKKQRIMPLDPFPLWPIIALVVVILVATILLMTRAGKTWWDRESARLDGSTTKTTQDLEDIVGAVIWVLLCMGILLGVLNQRHMAANVVLNVPMGKPVVFAYIWSASAFGAAVVAAVFAWPLFDCQVAWTTNEIVCGDGTGTQIQWNYFFGGVAFFSCVIAALFVFWASFKVLFSIPRKDDPTSTAFNRTKDQEATLLAKRRFGGVAGPSKTGSVLTEVRVGVTDAMASDPLSDDDDDYDVYGGPTFDAPKEERTVERHDRIRFDLASAFSKPAGNVLADSNLLPLDGTPVAASFFADNENASLLPQGRAVV